MHLELEREMKFVNHNLTKQQESESEAIPQMGALSNFLITFPQPFSRGGFVTTKGSAVVAHYVYHCCSHLIYVCMMNLADAITTNEVVLSDSARHDEMKRLVYWFTDLVSKHSIGMWRNYNMLCSIFSDYNPQELDALYQSIVN
jgi:hypothetical protein